MQWSIFCRVIDNFGDIGVCWRLAADLAGRGHRVDLYADDARALAWMAPGGLDGVRVRSWDDDGPVGDVVVEAFGCELPDDFKARMAAGPAAVWINLEYLSAEADVERSHGLMSPQWNGPAAGLKKWFFYPGFTVRTGGLLREPGLLDERMRFDAPGWLAAQGLTREPGETLVSVFAYDLARLPALVRWWQGLCGARAVQLVVTPGLADEVTSVIQRAVDGPQPCPGDAGAPWRVTALPAYLDQPGFDRLLWACDLNLVRGEDSFVRAQWAGQPFIWQIYPQHDDAHHGKLEAFLARFLAGAPLDVQAAVRTCWLYWNGLGASPATTEEAAVVAAWRDACICWRDGLATQPDLSTQLIEFVTSKR